MGIKDMINKMMQTPGSMAAKADDSKTGKKTKDKVSAFREGFTGSKSSSKKKKKKGY